MAGCGFLRHRLVNCPPGHEQNISNLYKREAGFCMIISGFQQQVSRLIRS